MVSVIVNNSADRTYLVRCLNSIFRQRVNADEIILVGEYNEQELSEKYNGKNVSFAGDLKTAIEHSSNEYLLICTNTSVLAPNAIQALLDAASSDTYYICNCMVPFKNNYVPYEYFNNPYGKLLLRQNVLDAIKDKSAQEIGECAFMLDYLNGFSEIKVLKEACLYESAPDALTPYIPGGIDQNWLEKLRILPEPERRNLALSWINKTEENDVPQRIMAIAKTLPDDKTTHYYITKDILCKRHRYVLSENDAKSFSFLQEYFNTVSQGEKFQDILGTACGLSKKQLECLKTENMNDYLFFYDKVSDDPDIALCSSAIEELRKQIGENSQRIKVLEARPVAAQADIYSPSVQKAVIDVLQGPALADQVISSYRSGKLGMGTIIKSAFAWLKFKIKKN